MPYNIDMEFYGKFLFVMAVGLLGVGLVIKTLLETLFNEWDAVADIGQQMKTYLKGQHQVQLLKAEDIMLEAEKAKRGTGSLATRGYESRRKELDEMSKIEKRLKSAPPLKVPELIKESPGVPMNPSIAPLEIGSPS